MHQDPLGKPTLTIEAFRPLVVPPYWHESSPHMCMLEYRGGGPAKGLLGLLTAQIEQDGKAWLHLSLSQKKRIPSWDQLRMAKEDLLGRDSLALQILPPAAEYVNFHPRCLHLWVCMDGRPTPDFRNSQGSI